MDQQGQHGQLHLAGFDLLAQVLRRAADHQAGEEDADDQVDQQVDQADAHAAADAVEPHAGQRREAGQRVEAVVHAVDRAVGRVRGQRGPGGAGRRAEAQFFAFQVAQRLIDRQAGRRAGIVDLVADRAASSAVASVTCVGLRVGVRRQRRVRLHGVPVHDPDRSSPAESTSITPKITAACRKFLSILPNMTSERDRDQDDAHARQEVGPAVRVLERMGAVGAEEAAAVGAECLIATIAATGPRAISCGLACRRRPSPIAPASTVVALALPSQRHRHAAGDQQHADDQAQRHEEIRDAAPQVDVEVAHVLVAAQAADDRHQAQPSR